MTCICGHSKADHQLPGWLSGITVDDSCDLCDCPQYVPAEALAAVDALGDKESAT